MARAHSGCEVLQQNFSTSICPPRLDGVSANAVLFHFPGQALPKVLAQLHATLKPGGVLFASNPSSDNQEGWRGERYGAFHDWPAWRDFLLAAGFLQLANYNRPAGLPPEQQPWLASVWRMPAA